MSDHITGTIGGVDCHRDTHTAAALDVLGAMLSIKEFPTTPAGYTELRRWLETFAPVVAVGVESTGSYGAALARDLAANGARVI